MSRRLLALWIFAGLGCASAAAAPHVAKTTVRQDALEPARAALRTLQFEKASALLSALGNAGNPDAEYLLGLMYLNGVGVPLDETRGSSLMRAAAERGSAPAAYVLAGLFEPHPGYSSGRRAAVVGAIGQNGLLPRGGGDEIRPSAPGQRNLG